MNRRIVFILFGLLGISIFIFLFFQIKIKEIVQEKYTPVAIHKVKFFEERFFNEGIDRAASIKPIDYHISGGVVPHDLFASFIIADFFKRLSFQNPKTIILLGPNHYEKGDFKVLTSLYGWSTKFGNIDPENKIINYLVEHNLAKIDEEVLPNDHAVSDIMPFIKYYLPKTKVVPILLSGGLTKSESVTLANNLSHFMDKDTVIIASTDFSHYLTSKEAEEKDKTTLQAISDYNLDQLYLFGNDHLDSPPSIGVMLSAMQKSGTTQMNLLNHSNSGELQKNAFIQTTSYFSLAFSKPGVLTIDQIFTPDHIINNRDTGNLRTIIATGDIIPARSVNFQTVTRKDFKWPYLKTADILSKADITFINLETPLIDKCPLTQEGMIFCGDSRNLEGLIYAGVDIANLANNHAGNYGENSIWKTYDLLTKNRILTVGVNGPMIKDIRGIRFGFLGYNDVTKPQPGITNVDEEKIKSEILEARKISDVVIITFHWGAEYQDQPDDRQKYLGHLAIDSGADLVIGNHPHRIQPVEIYKNKLITYAHGNFIFDQEWSRETKEGVVGKYTFYDKQLVEVEFLPVQIENYGQPYFLSGPAKDKILNNMRLQSEILTKD